VATSADERAQGVHWREQLDQETTPTPWPLLLKGKNRQEAKVDLLVERACWLAGGLAGSHATLTGVRG